MMAERKLLAECGFDGFRTVSELMKSCKDIPKEMGVYVVLREKSDNPMILEKRSFDCQEEKYPSYSKSELEKEWVEVEKVGDRYYAKRDNDWPDISGHFEWYCNEKLTMTQQMFDYVVAHRQTIVKQMQEVRRRDFSNPLDETSYYQDHYDEYQDDPEDELCFPPEIFNANDDSGVCALCTFSSQQTALEILHCQQ